MIQLINLIDEEIKAIGRCIGEAFYDEGEWKAAHENRLVGDGAAFVRHKKQCRT